jgi:hypothetical protein
MRMLFRGETATLYDLFHGSAAILASSPELFDQPQYGIQSAFQGRVRQHSCFFELFDVGQITQIREPKHFQEFLRRHVRYGAPLFVMAALVFFPNLGTLKKKMRTLRKRPPRC